MLRLFAGDPKKKLEKRYARLLEEAVNLQRAGKIPEHATKTAEAEEVLRQIEALEAKNA